jgi:DNA processing protein
MVDFGSRLLSDELLPQRLRDLPAPPLGVHVSGELPRGPSVAVVGTRRATLEARRFAFALSRDLARAGIVVLSGGAEGIDAAAHLGAIRGRFPTVVVAPAGFEKPFPARHRRLFERVLAHGGAYLSLRRPVEPALRSGFFARNGCLVALAHVVVVVEARYRSGARNAASWARRLGRPLLVVPNAPWIPTGRGCLLELRLGAKVCAGPGDVLDALEQALVLPPRRRLPVVEPEDQQVELPYGTPEEVRLATAEEGAELVVAAVRAGALHLDAVCERSGLSPAAVQRLILTLTLEGVLAADPAGRLGVAPAGGSVSARNSLK